jgi:hypothetical protein
LKIVSVPEKITFGDIPNASMTLAALPTNYKNLKWTGFYSMHEEHAKKDYPDSGWTTVFMPDGSPYIVFSSSSASISVDNENILFGVVSLEACAAANDNLQLTITGYRKSTQVKTHTSTLLFGKPQLIQLHWTDIGMIKFQSSGGSQHPGCRHNGSHFILNCLTISSPR